MGLSVQEYALGCLMRIVAQPGRYDQGTWQTIDADDVDMPNDGRIEVSCATTGCVAGTVAMLAGDKGIVTDGNTFMRKGKLYYDINRVITEKGRTVSVRDRGAELLELDECESSWLFSGGRLLPEVVYALIELSEGKQISKRTMDEMTPEEIEKLKNYRPTPAVKRQRVPAAPVTPQAQKVQHGAR